MEGYTSVEKRYKDTLFQLSHESEVHKGNLKKLISNLNGLSIENIRQDSRARENVKFNKHSQDVEILYEVYENDKLALDLYEKIYSNISREFIEEAWEGDDPDEFFETLSKLVEGEKSHIEEMEKHAQKLDRIK